MFPLARQRIESLRPPRNQVDPSSANAYWVDEEADGKGNIVSVATLLLTVNECPWRCAMCDLWKNTLTAATPPGAIVRQIESSLANLPSGARWIKLYNSGSFFDVKSIPRTDWSQIAKLCEPFERVIVENHPRLCGPAVADFQQLLSGQLEVALGVETLQPGMLRRLNKGMTRDHVDTALSLLTRHGIDSRAFVLVRPPWTQDDEGVRWALLTLRHLFSRGTRHTSLIPVRAGNGWIDDLAARGEFTPPTSTALVRCHQKALGLQPRGVITVDLWDWPPQGSCPHCAAEKQLALQHMNRTQQRLEIPPCQFCEANDMHCEAIDLHCEANDMQDSK